MVTRRQFDIDLQRAVRAGTEKLRWNFDFLGIWTRSGFERLEVLHWRREAIDLESRGASGLQIDHANGVVVSIGDVEVSVRDCQTGWFIKRRRWSISLSGLSGSKQRRDFPLLRIEIFDLVIVGVGDQQLVAVREQAERVLQANVVAGEIGRASCRERV